MKWFVAMFCATTLAACASMPVAQVRLPAELQTSSALTIEGIGGRAQGSFRMGGFAGTFHRRADAFSVGHPTAFEHSGQAMRLSMQGPGIDGTMDVECDVSEFSASNDGLAVDLAPRRVRCAFFRDGRREAADLVLNRRPGSGLSMEDVGELVWGDIRMAIRSTHQLEGTVFTTEDPAGYVFYDRGRPVAVVDVVGNRSVRIADTAHADVRVPVVLASLALAVMWA